MKYYSDAAVIQKLAGKTLGLLGNSVVEQKGKIYFTYPHGDRARTILLVADSWGRLWVTKDPEYYFVEMLGAKICKLTGVNTPELKLGKVDGEQHLVSKLVGNPFHLAGAHLVGEAAASVLVPRLAVRCHRPDSVKVNLQFLDIDLHDGNHLLGFDGKVYEVDFGPAPYLPADAVLHFLKRRQARLDCPQVWAQVKALERCNKFWLLWGVPEPFKTKMKVNISSLRKVVEYLIAKQR